MYFAIARSRKSLSFDIWSAKSTRNLREVSTMSYIHENTVERRSTNSFKFRVSIQDLRK